jgi:hypothetical protein
MLNGATFTHRVKVVPRVSSQTQIVILNEVKDLRHRPGANCNMEILLRMTPEPRRRFPQDEIQIVYAVYSPEHFKRSMYF